ncbi:MAG: polysaccharide biosynthesis protein [Leptolyngbyaceae cyanobacterium]
MLTDLYQLMTKGLRTFLLAITHLPRPVRCGLLFLGDAVLLVISIYAAIGFYLDAFPDSLQGASIRWLILPLIGLKLTTFLLLGNYQSVVRYGGSKLLLVIARSVLVSAALILAFCTWAPLEGVIWPPKVVLVIDALLTLTLIISFRLSVYWLIHRLSDDTRRAQRVLIYGAGCAGVQVAQGMTHDSTFRAVGFIDDDPSLHHCLVHGLRVYPFSDLPKLVERRAFDLVLLAIPSLGQIRRQQMVEQLQSLQVPVKTIPTLTELMSDRVSINTIRDIEINDLLGREEVPPDPALLSLTITGKVVLVTGAGGSIGSELCRQIAQCHPGCLILYEQNEFALYTIDLELSEQYPALQRVPILGSVTDPDHFSQVLTCYAVETVYHAAAYKHVPLLENNPIQAISNNVLGTRTVAQACQQQRVSHMVLISTDKAVRPTSVMGASKRVAELIVQALAAQPDQSTCFAIVRFGNVLGSSGSVVPRFRQQIAQGGPITITHPAMTRYFMSIPEAARLVMQAAAIAQGGEVFVLDMGTPVKVYDLAVQMIRLSGLEVGQDIEIEWVGLRPGERLYEELLVNQESAQATCHPKIFCAQEPKLSWEQLHPYLHHLLAAANQGKLPQLLQALHQLVPDYRPARPLVPESAGITLPQDCQPLGIRGQTPVVHAVQ